MEVIKNKSNELLYWVWLSSIPSIGAIKCKKLLEIFGEPKNVWDAKRSELIKLSFLNLHNINYMSDLRLKAYAFNHLEDISKREISVVTIHDEDYPQYLKNTYDPPIALYMHGDIKQDEKFLAVVGSRRASRYGLDMAGKIASELVKQGITVVSGMARGVDSYAHEGALKAGGRTIAVLGCGLNIVYPPENKKLMQKIIGSGAVISEYLPSTNPLPLNFPARNRIISGLSLGTVVIEAGERSGSLITANFALEQGREVFAVPGNISSMTSIGTNKLIKDGAKMVTDIDDILEEINILKTLESGSIKSMIKSSEKDIFSDLDEEETKIARTIFEDSLHIDAISKKSGLGIKLTNSILVMLELKGVVEQLPGKVFRVKY